MPGMPILIAILWTLLFYSAERLLFFAWNWKLYQTQPVADLFLSFVYALRFDISAIFILAVPAYLISLTKHKKLALVVFVLFQWPLQVINTVDAELFHFLGRRYTFDAFFLVREVPGKFFDLLLTYWPLALASSSLLLCYIFVILRIKTSVKEPRSRKKIWRKKLGLGLLTLVILLIGARGGLQTKPINFAHAQIFSVPAMNTLSLNSAFTVIQTMKRQTLPRDHFMDEAEALSYLNGASKQKSLLEGHRPNSPNVVLIILESFALEYVGKANQGQGFTPFLDELADQSLFFTNAFANGRRSIEGVGAIMGGIPALMNEPFISSQYLTNYFLGVGTLLAEKKYHSSFFHGAKNGTMYFDQFMKSAGVKNYFGLNEYPRPQDHDGTWGIWDEPFLQWSLKKIDEFPQPFFTSIFTLSSHHPFRVPTQYESILPQGTQDIHQTIAYTDLAVREFFRTAAEKPWFKNTIFILTADHTYMAQKQEYDNEIGHYRVPLWIYAPGMTLPKVDTTEVVSHIDILPTILDLVGIQSKDNNYLGRSVFIPGPRSAITYIDNRYYLIQKNYFMEYSRGHSSYKMFAMNDPNQSHSLEEPVAEKEKLQKTLQAHIQYFSHGMWDNKLYYPTGK